MTKLLGAVIARVGLRVFVLLAVEPQRAAVGKGGVALPTYVGSVPGVKVGVLLQQFEVSHI